MHNSVGFALQKLSMKGEQSGGKRGQNQHSREINASPVGMSAYDHTVVGKGPFSEAYLPLSWCKDLGWEWGTISVRCTSACHILEVVPQLET